MRTERKKPSETKQSIQNEVFPHEGARKAERIEAVGRENVKRRQQNLALGSGDCEWTLID